MKLRPGRSSLFLMELIAAILIFSLCMGVCLSLFLQAQSMTRDSADLTRAVFAAEGAAERFQAADGREDFVGGLGASAVDGAWVVYYDEDWRPAAAEGIYALRVELTEQNGLWAAKIGLLRGGEPIYSLTTTKYAPGEDWE